LNPLHAYLLAGLVAHKAVWEALRLRGERDKDPFRPVKLIKIALLAGFLLQPFLPPLLPIGAPDGFHIAVGTLVYTLGLAIAIAGRARLGRNWSNVESAALVRDQRLVDAGIYRHMRHPIYAGDVLLVAGYEVALNSWLALIAVPLAVYVWRKAGEEERLLAEKLPGYSDYMKRTGRMLPRCVAIGAAAAGFALLVHFTLVQYHYGGNWTAIYVVGDRIPIPPDLAAEDLYIFRGWPGYDGQFYHLMAHDPLIRGGYAEFIDVPLMRYPRILLPASAHLLALGRGAWIDPAFYTIFILTFGLGAWWLARFAEFHGADRRLGLAFLLVPAAVISLDRVTADVLLAALCCGFALYASQGAHGKVFAVLTLAGLTRDTGLLLWGSYGLFLLARRQWAKAILFGFAAAPAAAWAAYVFSRIPIGTKHDGIHFVPSPDEATFLYSVFLHRFFEPIQGVTMIATVLDYVSLTGVLAAVALGFRWFLARRIEPLAMATAVLAAFPFLIGGVVGWYDPLGYPRTLTPLFLLLMMAAIISKDRRYLVPLALLLPRIGMQLAPKIPGLETYFRR
jgi:protein-S-isoprenylcysteine O-methyltransferase Ste14